MSIIIIYCYYLCDLDFMFYFYYNVLKEKRMRFVCHLKLNNNVCTKKPIYYYKYISKNYSDEWETL